MLAKWVPPQSSRETSSTSTTRTHSPYFSPNRAIAPSFSASARDIWSALTGWLSLIHSLTRSSTSRDLVRGEARAVGEVEAELVGADRRAGLANVGAEPLPQGRVKQVGRGVVAHRRERATWSTSASTRVPGSSPLESGVELERLVLPDPVDVGDRCLAALPADEPGVGDLAAALRVERALLELHEGTAVVGLRREHAGLGLELLVADEPLGGAAEAKLNTAPWWSSEPCAVAVPTRARSRCSSISSSKPWSSTESPSSASSSFVRS